MSKLSNKLVKSRKAWVRQTTALGSTTRRASEAFAADTVDAATKFGKFARTEVKHWAGYIKSTSPEIAIPTVPAPDLSASDLERTLLTRLIATLKGLLVRARARLEALDGRGEALPIADYETLTARAILAELDELDAQSCRALRAFEAKNKARTTVLKALDQRLAA